MLQLICYGARDVRMNDTLHGSRSWQKPVIERVGVSVQDDAKLNVSPSIIYEGIGRTL